MPTAVEEEENERWRERVGKTIRGKWTLDRLLGVGGMAAVYSATHKIGRRDAIKILHPEIAISRELRSRFEQEAMAVGKLGHPGAVQVLDIDVTEDGAPFLVMELLDGENLGQRAYRLGGIPEKELLAFADQVLDVLGAAHALGIVHRDIKPDNLFITSDGKVKVLDFGIARMKRGGTGLKTRTGAMMGTTSYMAPEQIHGRDIDGRADLFAVGATMFRILAKRRLHEAESDADMLVKMGSQQAPTLGSVAPHVSPNIAKIVDAAVIFQAERRYPDAATMRTDIQAALRDEAPPFASQIAMRTDAPTSAATPVGAAAAAAAVLAAMPAAGAFGREATAATQAAPASFVPPMGFDHTQAPRAVAQTAMLEPTSMPVVLAQQPTTTQQRSAGVPAVFFVLGGVMLLLGVSAGLWLMLGRGDDAKADRTSASRAAEAADAEESADAADSAKPSADGTAEPSSTTDAPPDPSAPATDPAAPARPTATPPTRPAAPPTATARPVAKKKPDEDDNRSKGPGKGKKKGKKERD